MKAYVMICSVKGEHGFAVDHAQGEIILTQIDRRCPGDHSLKYGSVNHMLPDAGRVSGKVRKEAIMATTTKLDIAQAAKMLRTTPRKLRQLLRSEGDAVGHGARYELTRRDIARLQRALKT